LNQSQVYKRKNDFLREYFKTTFNIRENRFNENCHNSDEHEVEKLRIYLLHRRLNHDVVTEIPFLNGSGRADVVCLTCEEAYEIVESESEASIERKKKDYPIPINVVVARELP